MATGTNKLICDALRSRKAYAAFSFSACWALVFGVLFVVYFVTIEGTPRDFASPIPGIALGGLGLIGSAAGLCIFLGMLAYLLKCDPSGRPRKIFWLMVFLVGACFGSSLYFFLVARKEIQKQRHIIS